MNFELSDQFDKRLAYTFPRKKVSVLTFGDRRGSLQIEGWVRPLYKRYQDRIDLYGVAVLSSIPPLLHGYTRRLFKKVKYPVLLDFSGDVSREYGYEENKANIYIIARDGSILLKITGAATPEKLNRVYDQVDQFLTSQAIKPEPLTR